MVSDLEFSYRKVYFDNYFTTPDLLEYLHKKGIYAAGTIRTNRKAIPKEFCESTKKMRWPFISSHYTSSPYNSSQLNFVPLQFVSLQFIPFTIRSTYISSHYDLSPYNPSHIRFVPYSLSLCILSQFFAVNIHSKIIK